MPWDPQVPLSVSSIQWLLPSLVLVPVSLTETSVGEQVWMLSNTGMTAEEPHQERVALATPALLGSQFPVTGDSALLCSVETEGKRGKRGEKYQ